MSTRESGSSLETPSADKTQMVEQIHRTIQELRDLPTLPAIALEVRRLAADPNINMGDIVAVIEEDVALTSRILRIANSAYYGVPRKIDNLKMALVILGMTEISNLVLTITVLKMFPGKTTHTFDMMGFWRHSAVCAEVTVGLYQGLGQRPPTSAYIAGLLHDMGKLVLDQHFNEAYTRCIQRSRNENLRLVDAELSVLGVDHGHVGAWLCRRWNLPEEIVEAVAQHHIRPAATSSEALAVYIDWADRISHLMEENADDAMRSVLVKDHQWSDWSRLPETKTISMVDKLRDRLSRSLTMINLLG